MNLKVGSKIASVLQLRAEFLDRKVRPQRANPVTHKCGSKKRKAQLIALRSLWAKL